MAAIWALFAAINAALAANSFAEGNPALGVFSAVIAVFMLFCAIREM